MLLWQLQTSWKNRKSRLQLLALLLRGPRRRVFWYFRRSNCVLEGPCQLQTDLKNRRGRLQLALATLSRSRRPSCQLRTGSKNRPGRSQCSAEPLVGLRALLGGESASGDAVRKRPCQLRTGLKNRPGRSQDRWRRGVARTDRRAARDGGPGSAPIRKASRSVTERVRSPALLALRGGRASSTVARTRSAFFSFFWSACSVSGRSSFFR